MKGEKKKKKVANSNTHFILSLINCAVGAGKKVLNSIS